MEYLKLIAALVTSIGGTSVVVLGLSKFFGNFLANKLLGDFKNKHERELEGIKSKYQKDLEETKAELERAKLLFSRYSEKQFSTYNNLWGNLLFTRKQLEALWQNPALDKIPSFSQQVSQARTAIDDNMLLIHDADFNKLDTLIKKLEHLDINGESLESLAGIDLAGLQGMGMNDTSVITTTSQNSPLRQDFMTVINEVGTSFRNQIKG